MRVTGRRALDALRDGTLVTAEVDIRFRGLATPLTWLLAPAYRRQHRHDLDRLEALLARQKPSASRHHRLDLHRRHVAL